MGGHATQNAYSASEMLASEIDRHFCQSWNKTEPAFGWIGNTSGGPLGQQSDTQLCFGFPPECCVTAIAVTALATAVDSQRYEKRIAPVRITLAVSCCESAVFLRSPDGRVLHSSDAKGVLTRLLRGWAILEKCLQCRQTGMEAAG